MTDPVRRPHYFFGQLLTPEDFQLEQDYHRDMRRMVNRRLGHGVVEGLDVSMDAKGRVTVTPGIAIDRLGRELVVTQEWRGNGRQPSTRHVVEQVVSALWAEFPDSPVVPPQGCPPEQAFTRWLELPQLAIDPAAEMNPDAVVLARIHYGKGHPVVTCVPRIGLPPA